MKKSSRSGRGTKADDNQRRTSGMAGGNLDYGANKIAQGAIAPTGNRSDSAAPTLNSRTLQVQATTVAPMDTDRANDNLSHGKISDPDAVTKYADAISGNWQHGVEAFLEIARLCAEAEERLDPAQQAELKAKLPFGAATFSKFRQIGLDARLRKPEIQVLLPAAYTTIYAITCLNDEDLNVAITEKIINPDVKREKLEKWRVERQEARQQKPSAPRDAAAAAANPVSLTVDSSVAAVVEEFSVSDEAPVSTVDAPQLVPPAPSEPMPAAATDVTTPSPSVAWNLPSMSDVHPLSPNDQQAFNENEPADNIHGDTQRVTTESPSLVPQGDANASSGVDDGPLSDDEQRALDKLISDWNETPKRAQDRFVSEVLGLDPSSSSTRTRTGGQS
jgi:hypothetical protein